MLCSTIFHYAVCYVPLLCGCELLSFSLEDSDQSGDDEGQTGKIHISNRQLEHLKQKMQVLKQRKASTEDKEEKKEDAKAEIVHSNCPGAHGLRRNSLKENTSCAPVYLKLRQKVGGTGPSHHVVGGCSGAVSVRRNTRRRDK